MNVIGSEQAKIKRPRYTVPVTHPAYSVAPCPNCKFPEAEGGFCPECGWTRHTSSCRCLERRRR